MPPEEFRLYDPAKSGMLKTPLDERGLVDLDELVRTVKATVSPEFTWVSEFNDVHHLQWYANLYKTRNGDLDLTDFRELVNRKAYVPRAFHNWTHAVTSPPPVPEMEVMRYSINAQRVAMSLARTASLAVRLTRMAHIPDRRLGERLDREFENYNVYVENAREVPLEFSLVAINEIEARSPEDLIRTNKILGRMALDRIPVRLRALTA